MTLEPCPFCGVNDAIKERISITGHSYVYHLFNGCVLGGKSFSSEEWDTRAYPKRLTAEELWACLDVSQHGDIDYGKTSDNINNHIFGGSHGRED